MALELKLHSALTASTTLSGEVSTRIYPVHGVQGGAMPSIVYQRISGEKIISLQGEGTRTLENARIQFDIYTTALDQLRTVGDALLSALHAATAITAIPLESPEDIYDDEVGIHRRILDVSVWNSDT